LSIVVVDHEILDLVAVPHSSPGILTSNLQMRPIKFCSELFGVGWKIVKEV